MRLLAVFAGILGLSACASTPDVISLDDIRDARGDLPGVETVINCDRAPRIIFDKNGEIVETIQPVRHPSCPDSSVKNAGLVRQGDMFLIAGRGPSPYNEASDDDFDTGRRAIGGDTTTVVVPGDSNPASPPKTVTPAKPALPCTSMECEPTDVKEWVAWRKHFGIATTKQDIHDHVEKYGGTW